ncbi:ParB/RepB/Spo0J family partition protein [Aureimonas mangrovi]|uniref:ParB/RepB/Spo0J family partition protein n=1 Tax=Aureimonas mangrovi TaxID=2758041 RepID=UPI00163DCC85|nr:ParB N-terminal domain-containing protein [Aureimonas mangrovi]
MADKEDFAPAALMAGLAAEMEKEAGPCGPLPPALPLADIETMPALFQVRELYDQHAEDIARALRDGAEVPPLLVLRAGRRVIVIDGHHRLEAHRLAGKLAAVPVVGFEGTLREAVLEACARNSVTKLPMTAGERQDAAWRYVCLGVGSKAQIAKASGSSTATVARMREVAKRLGPEAFETRSWWHAMRLDREAERGDQTEEDRLVWIEATAQRYADTMARTFGKKLTGNAEIAARAMAIHFGRRLESVVQHLGEWLPDEREGDY